MLQSGISVTTESIVRVFLVAFFAFVAYEVRGVLLLIFISIVLSTVLHPLASFAKRFHIPRGLTVILVYIFGAGLLFGVGYALIPLLTEEIISLAENFNTSWDKIIALVPVTTSDYLKDALQNNINAVVSTLQGGVGVALAPIISTVQGVLTLLGSVVVVLVLTFYLVVEEENIRNSISILTPKKYTNLVPILFTNIQRRLGGWARGQIILSCIIGAMVYVALSIIGVPYAFALGALAMLLEFIPYVGPIASGVFGIFFALTVSPTVAIITAIAYYIIQQLENNLIVPKVMQKTAGVNPVLSIISILMCFQFFGVIGVFLGVPIASLAVAVMHSFLEFNGQE